MRRGGQKTDVRRMPAVHVGMRDAAEHGEVVPMLLQHFQIRRRHVIPAGAGGKNWPGSRPRLLQIANIRRGVALGASGDETSAARANGAIIESRNGSDTRRRRPGENGGGTWPAGDDVWRLAVEFRFGVHGSVRWFRRFTWSGTIALHQFGHDAAHAVLSFGGALQNFFNRLPVRKTHRRARGINRKLADEIAGDGHRVLQPESFSIRGRLETRGRPAASRCNPPAARNKK